MSQQPQPASSVSGFSLEDIAQASPAGHWFQLYRFRSRPGMENLVHRAKAAGYQAIVATVDTQTGSKRERDRQDLHDGHAHAVDDRDEFLEHDAIPVPTRQTPSVPRVSSLAVNMM